MTVTVIEGGAEWMNLKSTTTNVAPQLYLTGDVLAAVTAGLLPGYATTNEAVQMFRVVNIASLAPPVFVADSNGYNSGNILLGLV